MIAITGAERAVLNNLEKEYEKIGKKPIINWHQLRLESAVLGTQSDVPFAVNNNDASITMSSTEQRLDIVDQFTATRVAMFLIKVPSGGSRVTQRLRTWTNPKVFTGSNEATNLTALYNSWLRIEVNNIVYFPGMDTYNFWYVPVLPEFTSQNIDSGTNASASSYVLADARKGTEDGFVEMIPTVTFSGGKKNTVLIDLPASSAMVGTSSDNYVVLMFRGFLHQNVNSGNINSQR